VKFDGYGYEFLSVDIGTVMNFYPSLLTDVRVITLSEFDPLPSLLERDTSEGVVAAMLCIICQNVVSRICVTVYEFKILKIYKNKKKNTKN
jgi:hypothetical protein